MSLINLSRMENPKTKRINLTGYLSETLRTVNIPGTVERDRDLPEVSVFVDIDREQIRMALENIIQNAVKAMGEAGALSIEAGSPIAGDVKFLATDAGPGIPPEHLATVFEPLLLVWNNPGDSMTFAP